LVKSTLLKRWGVSLALAISPMTLVADDSVSMVDILIARNPDSGLVSEGELKALGIDKDLQVRALNRVETFKSKLDVLPASEHKAMTANFHEDLYEFILKEKHQNHFDAFQGHFVFGIGHESDVSLRPDGEPVPSSHSSVTRHWDLLARWQGRQSPWGEWAFSLQSEGLDYEADVTEAYDLHDLSMKVDVEYDSGWNWSLEQSWMLYGASGSHDLGDAVTRWDMGYGRDADPQPYLKAWDVAFGLEKHNYAGSEEFGSLGEKRDRWLSELKASWDFGFRSRRYDSSLKWTQAIQNSSSDDSRLEYLASKSDVSLVVEPLRNRWSFFLDLGYLKKMDHRNSVSKANDSYWMGEAKVARPLWNELTEGSVRAFYRDLRSKQSSVEFSGEGVEVEFKWSW
jgi:hypothetical protein